MDPMPKMQTRWYTVIYRHTFPETTWGDEPSYRNRNYPEAVLREKIYGREAGKPTETIFIRAIEARDHLEIAQICAASAIKGWGSEVLFVFEGKLLPLGMVNANTHRLTDRERFDGSDA